MFNIIRKFFIHSMDISHLTPHSLQTIMGKEMLMLKEFKEFAMRGSVVDLAIGIIIGGAFGKIVSS